MDASTIRKPCVRCNKGGGITICGGCQQWFCTKHFLEHRADLTAQMNDVSQKHDHLERDLVERDGIHPLLSRINDWEQRYIKKIRETAEEVRMNLQKYVEHRGSQLKVSFCQLTRELKSSRQSEDYTETELKRWIKRLHELRQRLEKPLDVNIINENKTQSMIRLVQVKHHQTTCKCYTLRQLDQSFFIAAARVPDIVINAKWTPKGITVAGGNGQGDAFNQLSKPRGLYVNNDQTVYIADCGNHRIMEWQRGAASGQAVAGGNGHGNRCDQLHYPTDVLIDQETDDLIICDYGNQRAVQWPRRNGKKGETIISNMNCHGLSMVRTRFFYGSDYEKNAVRRYDEEEADTTIVAGDNGTGNLPDQLNYPTYVFAHPYNIIYVSDTQNHRVVKWKNGANEGVIVAGGRGQGNNLTQLSYPRQMIVDSLGTVYVADCGNHRVMRWSKGATHGTVIVGGNTQGKESNKLNCPWGLSFDTYGNLYVADWGNNRVQRFNIAANLH